MRSHRVRRLAGAVAIFAAAVTAFAAANPAGAATGFVPLVGDGSSWAQPAIDQWSRDVNSQGITINFSGDGSAAGRQHYIENQADFAASDIAFLTTPDPFGAGTESSSYAYSYVPIVAGGTAFMYNLVVGGKKVTNLRLSGETLAKIFTGQITNWNDPAITHDYGAPLPSQQITVVTRSDGAGASYMFSRWLWKQYPSIWSSFCHAQGGAGSCGPTEFYPRFNGSVQRNGSDQVASYVASPSFGQGSIGYDEYAYALNNNIPVVKLLNSAGYYTLPTASNVAIALQKAVIDENPKSPTFLMQNLDQVYTNPDPRTYPLSSYSYLIVPRNNRVINGNNEAPPPRFNTDKGRTLSTWMNYVLCGAQQKAGQLGYSPLPKNLVVGGFKQIDEVPGHVATPDLKQLNGCNNPTYSDGVNHLIVDAPMPSKCDKAGTPLTCGTGAAPAGGAGTGSPGGNGNHGGNNGGNANNGGGGTRNSAGGGGSGGNSTAPAGGGSSRSVDPDTGLPANTGGGSGDSTTTGGSGTVPLAAVPVALNTPTHNANWLMAGLTAVDIIAAIVLPGLLIGWLRKRKRAAE
jgi:phosphate ABC transporter phosphate-binding protein